MLMRRPGVWIKFQFIPNEFNGLSLWFYAGHSGPSSLSSANHVLVRLAWHKRALSCWNKFELVSSTKGKLFMLRNTLKQCCAFNRSGRTTYRCDGQVYINFWPYILFGSWPGLTVTHGKRFTAVLKPLRVIKVMKSPIEKNNRFSSKFYR